MTTEDDNARRKKTALDDKNFTSSKISDQARTIGLALAALTMFFLTSDSHFAKRVIADYRPFVLAISAAGCLVVVCDYLQYLAGYRASDVASLNVAGGYRYDVNSCFYVARHRLFAAKHVLAVAGALGLIGLIVVAMFTEGGADLM